MGLPGAGTEPLTWGQWSLGEAMVRHGSWMPPNGARPLVPGTTVQDVEDEPAGVLLSFSADVRLLPPRTASSPCRATSRASR
ncbi:hypothetical protein [Kitasatospora cineracea]|uniref:hypothetical protein n=1 Tax=Kitasatospora cineracea TaxID=88074 RepID=UPI0034067D71